MHKLINFYKQYSRPEDAMILGSLFLAALIGAIYMLTNAFNNDYSGNEFISWNLFLGLPLMITLFSLALLARTFSPRLSLITWTYTTYYFMLLGIGLLVYGVQFTPFHPVDSFFTNLDKMVGFNQTALLDWTHRHQWLDNLFNQAYSLIGFELSFIPLILAFLFDRRNVNVLLIAMIFSFLIGTTIYYFWPTTAPASMFFDSHFMQQQHATFIKFFEIHHHLPITTQAGGLIAFPSFHVVWCVQLAYVLRRYKWLFYPVAALNAIIVLSTLFLGWHYLTDVIGGIALATLSISIAEKVYQKWIVQPGTRAAYLTTFKLGRPLERGGLPGSGGSLPSSPSSSSLKTIPRPFSKA